MGAERLVQYTDGVLKNYIFETHMLLLTDVTTINLIQKTVWVFFFKDYNTLKGLHPHL